MTTTIADPLILRTVALCGAALLVGGAAVVGTGDRELRRRWLVWLAAAPIVIGAVLVPPGVPLLAVLFALVSGLELARLLLASAPDTAHARSRFLRPFIVAACVGPAGIAVVLHVPSLVAAVAAAVSVPPLWFVLRRIATSATAPLCVAAAFGVVGIPLAVLATAPVAWVLPAMVSVSFADVAGYAAGRLLGRRGVFARPISVASPNKTVAGLLGSLVVGGAVLGVLGCWWLIPLVPIWGVLGDLRESRLKRTARVKDAGSWLPGFGGLLDRIDSVLGAMVGVGVSQASAALALAGFVAVGGTIR